MSLYNGYTISNIEKYFRHRKKIIQEKLDNTRLTNAEYEYYTGIHIELKETLERFFHEESQIIYNDFRLRRARDTRINQKK
jgi:hypothetical protein